MNVPTNHNISDIPWWFGAVLSTIGLKSVRSNEKKERKRKNVYSNKKK